MQQAFVIKLLVSELIPYSEFFPIHGLKKERTSPHTFLYHPRRRSSSRAGEPASAQPMREAVTDRDGLPSNKRDRSTKHVLSVRLRHHLNGLCNVSSG